MTSEISRKSLLNQAATGLENSGDGLAGGIDPTLVIKTSGYFLRHFQRQDADGVALIMSDPEVASMAGKGPDYSVESARDWLALMDQLSASGLIWPLGIFEQSGGRLIGCVTLQKDAADSKELELSYWLEKSRWGKGIIPDTVGVAIQFAGSWTKFDRIWAGVKPANSRSIRVLEKLGMSFIGRYAETRARRDSPETYLRYALDRSR